MNDTYYQLVIIDSVSGERAATIPINNIKHLRYTRVINGIGKIAVTFPITTKYTRTFYLDNFMEVYRTHPVSGVFEREETYFIRVLQRFVEDDQEWVVVGGVSLNHLLTRRVVDPEDDPLKAGGYSTKAGAADNVIAGYVYDQMGAGASAERRIPNFTIKPTLGVGRPLGARLQHEKLYNEVRRMAMQGGVDFYISRLDGNKLQFAVEPIGRDFTYTTNYPGRAWVGFSLSRGNIEQAEYVLDRAEELNYCYALGPGNVGDRIILKVAGSGVNESPYNRIEFIHDARNVEKTDALALLSEAQGALVSKRYEESYTFTPVLGRPGSTYNKDWMLGDKVSFIQGVTDQGLVEVVDLRIMEVEIDLDSGFETIKAKADSTWQEAENF